MATYYEEQKAAKMASLDRLAAWIATERLTNNIVTQRAGISGSSIFYANKNESGVTIKMADKICAAFPRLNKQWLLYGEGDMYLTDEEVQNQKNTSKNTNEGSGNSAQIGSYNRVGNIKQVTTTATDQRTLEQLTSAILNQQDITRKVQEQSDRLIAIIEKMQNNG